MNDMSERVALVTGGTRRRRATAARHSARHLRLRQLTKSEFPWPLVRQLAEQLGGKRRHPSVRKKAYRSRTAGSVSHREARP